MPGAALEGSVAVAGAAGPTGEALAPAGRTFTSINVTLTSSDADEGLSRTPKGASRAVTLSATHSPGSATGGRAVEFHATGAATESAPEPPSMEKRAPR